jgi:hypothetical protein
MTTTLMTIRRLPREELREVVLGIVDSRIVTTDQVPSDLIGMVFMPLMFGAMTPPDGVLPPRPEEPEAERMPPPPPTLTLPDAPPEPTPPEPPPYPTEQMELVRWGRLLEEDVLPPYEDALARHEASLDEWRRNTLTAHEVALDEHRERCRVLTEEHEARMVAHAAACDVVRERTTTAYAAYTEAKGRYDAESKEVYRQWTADVGIVYEYYDKAGPRGINGYPMFTSCRILHREDWDIVRPAVQREYERRKNEDILGGP